MYTFTRSLNKISLLKMDSLSRGQLASRLTLNCLDSYVEPQKLKDVYITVMDVTTPCVTL